MISNAPTFRFSNSVGIRFNSAAADNDRTATIREYRNITDAAEKTTIAAVANRPLLSVGRSWTTAAREKPAIIPASPASAADSAR